MDDNTVEAVRDDSQERPVPTAWRSTFAAIVARFVEGDFGLLAAVPAVAPIDAQTSQQIETYVREYGATLIPLPMETWSTSVCIWDGQRWHVLVDLWTREEGRSDMVLHAHVTDSAAGSSFAVHLVYVP